MSHILSCQILLFLTPAWPWESPCYIIMRQSTHYRWLRFLKILFILILSCFFSPSEQEGQGHLIVKAFAFSSENWRGFLLKRNTVWTTNCSFLHPLLVLNIKLGYVIGSAGHPVLQPKLYNEGIKRIPILSSYSPQHMDDQWVSLLFKKAFCFSLQKCEAGRDWRWMNSETVIHKWL